MLYEIKRFNKEITENSIILICVIWNEMLLLPFFIDHYSNLGVSHFIFIDNNSADNTLKYLQSRTDIDVNLYTTTDSYAQANYGIDWVNEILNTKALNKWCLVVDADELLLLPDENSTLVDIKKRMEKNQANILQTVLIDFYPKSFSSIDDYIIGTSFFKHSNWFHQFTKDTIWSKGAPDGSTEIKGGLRHVMENRIKKPNSTSVCLTKKSFFKNNFYKTHELKVGMHWILPKDFTCWWPPDKAYSNWSQTNQYLNFFNEQMIIAHFKYIKPNIKKVFELRVERNQDWNNSNEYKKYLNWINKSFYDDNLSKCFTTPSALYQCTVYALD